MKRFETLVLLCFTIMTQSVLSFYQPTHEVGKKLKNTFLARNGYGRDQAYPMEYGLGYYYQGDIILKPERSGLIYNEMLWPNSIVPYVYATKDFSTFELETIQRAMDQFKQLTCVQFVPRTTETHYVSIWNNQTGCHSYLGFNANNNNNQINLQSPECTTFVGTPVHEMMHTLGAIHEFTRADRDNYISINRKALLPQYQTDKAFNSNFAIASPLHFSTYSTPYNYNSVMHYSRYAGAANKAVPVMTPKQLWFGDFGNNYGLSGTDVQLIRSMYC